MDFAKPREPLVRAIAEWVATRKQEKFTHDFDCECDACQNCEYGGGYTKHDLQNAYYQGVKDGRSGESYEAPAFTEDREFAAFMNGARQSRFEKAAEWFIGGFLFCVLCVLIAREFLS
jgi:hypothetical protein